MIRVHFFDQIDSEKLKKLRNYVGFKKNVDVDFYLQQFTFLLQSFFKKKLKIYVRILNGGKKTIETAEEFNFLTFE